MGSLGSGMEKYFIILFFFTSLSLFVKNNIQLKLI